MAKNEVKVQITVEEKAALRALTALTKGVDKFGDETVKSTKKANTALDSFKGNIAAIGAAGAFKAISNGLFSIVTGALSAATATEKIRTQLEVLTGSTETASDLFKELTEFSASTPFQLQNIAEASAQLISFGFAASSVRDRVESIGEVAAGSNSDLKEVALIYGQVAAAGKLTGERLLQFQERAIPIGAALAKSLGVAESEVKGLVSAGVVGFPQFESAFNSMSQAGGLFEGAIDKQSKTIGGLLSTLNDNLFLMQNTLGEAIAPAFGQNVAVVTQAFQELTKAISENEKLISTASGFVGDYISFYATLATNLIKVETPLSKVDKQIEALAVSSGKLSTRIKLLDEDRDSWFRFFGADVQSNINKTTFQLKAQEEQLAKLLAERKKLLNISANTEELDDSRSAQAEHDALLATNAKKLETTRAANAKLVEQRRLLHSELDAVESERNAKEAESRLAQDALNIEGRALEIESIKFHEIQKADAVLEVQLQKNEKIKDMQSRELADKKAFVQNDIAITAAQSKAKKSIAEQELKDEQVFFQKAISLSTSKNKELAAIGKAAGLLQIAQATPPAVASSYNFGARIGGPFLGATFGGIAFAAQAAQAAKMAGFANGGVLGGFNGATTGDDTQTFRGRKGEMVLNGPQQRQLFDVANNNSQPQNGGNLELTTIVQIDEREIARSVRNQKLDGFAA